MLNLSVSINRSVVPKLFSELNLLSNTLDPRITFTRGSTKTYIGADGLLKTAAVNECPLEYDPVTLLPVGRSFWEARTNIVTYSNYSFSQWSSVGSNTTTGLAPDGTNNAVLFSETTANSGHYMNPPLISVISGTVYAISVFVKPSTGRYFQIGGQTGNFGIDAWANFDLQTGVATGTQGPAVTAVYCTKAPLGYYKCTIVCPAVATNSGSTIFYSALPSSSSTRAPTYSGTGLSYYLFGSQVEAGSTPSSLINTSGSQSTRAAEVATVNDLNSIRFNTAQGAIYAEYTLGLANKSVSVFHLDDNTGSASKNFIAQRYSSGALAQGMVVGPNAEQTSSAPSGFSTPGLYKRVLAWNSASIQQAINGSLPFSSVPMIALPQNLNILRIGQAVGAVIPEYICAPIKRLRFYQSRPTNADLQAMTQ